MKNSAIGAVNMASAKCISKISPQAAKILGKVLKGCWQQGRACIGPSLSLIVSQCGDDEYQFLSLKYCQRPLNVDLGIGKSLNAKHDFLVIESRKQNATDSLHILAEKLAAPLPGSRKGTGRTAGIFVDVILQDQLPPHTIIYQVQVNKWVLLCSLLSMLTTSFEEDYNFVLDNCWKYASSAAQASLIAFDLDEEAQKLVDVVTKVHEEEPAYILCKILTGFTKNALFEKR